MPTTTSLEFQRKFGQYLNESHREPVEITRHGRREFVLMSAAQYDELLAAAQRSGRTVKAASEPERN
ncbi:prevent-host-death family protein [Ochrobactrum sp. 19YEA23]|uniref:type II toxin-antitoxin system prevent-host-death family antitoxin n=1 Tax=Ochrobactrum sp. 19YEA23 TaxID=3039854 RepID=UPI002478F1CD|nr:prevent-host-death family protein [Ochrobactrum sp. 19YEA23]